MLTLSGVLELPSRADMPQYRQQEAWRNSRRSELETVLHIAGINPFRGRKPRNPRRENRVLGKDGGTRGNETQVSHQSAQGSQGPTANRSLRDPRDPNARRCHHGDCRPAAWMCGRRQGLPRTALGSVPGSDRGLPGRHRRLSRRRQRASARDRRRLEHELRWRFVNGSSLGAPPAARPRLPRKRLAGVAQGCGHYVGFDFPPLPRHPEGCSAGRGRNQPHDPAVRFGHPSPRDWRHHPMAQHPDDGSPE